MKTNMTQDIVGEEMEQKSLNVLIGDPASKSDPFGVVGLHATYPEKKIHIKHARQFIKKPYERVAKHFKSQWDKGHIGIMLLEKNHGYDEVSKAFSGLPIQYVYTCASLKDSNRHKQDVMDKHFMIEWYGKAISNDVFLYPKVMTAEIAELIKQVELISEINGSFKAKAGRHDDLFMAKLIGCDFIRKWWDEQ